MQNFDYIIVGSGSAGSALANRLSANPQTRVLLLEQGPPDNSLLIDMPIGFGALIKGNKYFTHHVAPSQTDGAPEIWPAGRTLGGSSSVNGLVWSRCQVEDYQRLAELGNIGWSWEDMLPYLKALEDHADHEPNDPLRGTGGPITITTQPDRYNRQLCAAFIQSGIALGVPHRLDMNGVDQEGIGFSQRNIDRRGRRVSAAKAFLHPIKSRKNLVILTNAMAERILVKNGRAIGVCVARGGNQVDYTASGEVIVSCGTLSSPLLLQRSGIGPAKHLAAKGVSIVADIPGVGHNLREKRHMIFQYTLNDPSESHNRRYSGLRALWHTLQYIIGDNGPMCETLPAVAYVRTQTGLSRPDAEVMLMPVSQEIGPSGKPQFQKQPGFRILCHSLRPTSTGSVLLDSLDPRRQGAISFEHIATDHDRSHAVSLGRFVRKMTAQPIWAPLLVGEQANTAWGHTDDDIIRLFKEQAQPGAHACGTCAMGQDENAVVDERLRVRGVAGLRVADLSVFPEMLSGHTNAPVMALALRAADLILEDARTSR